MTHLKIIQNNTLADTEEVSQEIIQKLYDLAASGDLDAEIKGRLHLTAGYRAQAEYLHQMFPNLIISIDDYIIPFEDSKMVTYLNSIGVGNNGVITEADAAAATVVANSQNTEVTKFNELKYFTSITESRGGINGNSDGWVKFSLWTALEEVDISNFTSIGHASDSGGGDTFNGCSSLKKVTASNKLQTIGRNCFYGCGNLEDILGLDGVITVYKQVFFGCNKLKGESFNNAEILFVPGEHSVFKNCNSLTSVVLSDANTTIPSESFDHSGIENVNFPANITSLGTSVFLNSKLKSADLSNTTILDIPYQGFWLCENLTTVVLPNTCTTLNFRAFSGCNNLSTINLNNITNLKDSALAGAGLGGNLTLNLINLEKAALADTNITSIDLSGSSITSIPEYCLQLCRSLTTVNLPSTCTTLKTNAFWRCNALTTINLGNVTTFGEKCLCECYSLSQIEFPSGVSIGYNSFTSSGITSVRFRGSGTVDISAFEGCNSLTSLVFDGDVKLGLKAFNRCLYLTSVDLSNISESSLFYRSSYDARSQFSECSRLLQVTLNPNITKLPPGIFGYIDAELYVTIPAGVTDMSNSFYGTHSHLTMLPTTPPTLLGDSPLEKCREIIVPAGTLATYQAASGWSLYADIMSESTT